MRTCNILCLVGEQSLALGEALSARLHIPFYQTINLASASNLSDPDAIAAAECRRIADLLEENGTTFAVLNVRKAALSYLPSALLLSARTTCCTIGTASPFADICVQDAPLDQMVENVVGAWLSPEILSSFSGNL